MSSTAWLRRIDSDIERLPIEGMGLILIADGCIGAAAGKVLARVRCRAMRCCGLGRTPGRSHSRRDPVRGDHGGRALSDMANLASALEPIRGAYDKLADAHAANSGELGAAVRAPRNCCVKPAMTSHSERSPQTSAETPVALSTMRILIVAALASAAAGAHAGSVEFTCASGARLQVQFLDNAAEVRLPDGRAVTLAQERTADGYGYSGLGIELRGVGSAATLTQPPTTEGRKVERCHALPAPPAQAASGVQTP
jgi:hypothetical protein